MKLRFFPGFFLVVGIVSNALSSTWGNAWASNLIHHEIKIQLNPSQHSLKVDDTITVPRSANLHPVRTLEFLLHDGLHPLSPTPGISVRPTTLQWLGELPIRHYSVTLPTDVTTFNLTYAGTIYHPLKGPDNEYDRSFGETPGLISNEGIYLANSSVWYPRLNGENSNSELFTFTLDIELPSGWDAISQGNRASHIKDQNQSHVRWESPEPQNEMYLIGAKFHEYEQNSDAVNAMAFLRTPDSELANKYLEATSRYVKMYNQLLGQYPYRKFALVENFWETGYGMPSFTLLGEKIIRFPFIISSSYPHEILHNWWGNGVYVDYSTGNWCEGLTAYLADHLMKEQLGGGAEYRRATLQKYTDYAQEGNDFPLNQFQERHNSVTEAVGYGKALMLFHMLRQSVGDELFIQTLRKFYETRKFTHAAWDDFRGAIESVSGRSFTGAFNQWVTRTGAPSLRVRDAKSRPISDSSGDGFEVTAVLEQTQEGAAYELEVPVAVSIEGNGAGGAYQTKIATHAKQVEFKIRVPARPYQLDIDPEYDVFRRLDRYEIPTSVSQALGAKKTLILIAASAPDDVRKAYLTFAKSVQDNAENGETLIKMDDEITTLPSDQAIWVFGAETQFKSQILASLKDYDFSIDDHQLRIAEMDFTRTNHSLVVTARNPGNPAQVLGWIIANPVSAASGLDRKLPHYGKYSYLVFEGTEPKNVAKGIWPTVNSPMSIPVIQPDGTIIQGPKAKLAPRSALIEMPPAFSQSGMASTINFLTQDRIKGRELGTPELDEVAQHIASQFRAAGLQPREVGLQFDDKSGSYLQTWSEELKAPKGQTTITNVIGVIPGKNSALNGQPLVIGAHYDHLGLGWPDAHGGNVGKIHHGADDNASGVALLIELARTIIASGQRPDRTLVFVAFSGEEAGLLGSRHFVEMYKRSNPNSKIFAMLNFDTIGRLGTNKLTIFGVGSAREWAPIFSGAGYTTGVQIEPVTTDIAASDHQSFIETGIPAVQFFSGANLDYHRPTDTADKIDYSGLLKIASVAKEVIDYLAQRAEPLTSTLNPTPPPNNPPDHPGTGKRAFLGTVPDFAYAGKGTKIASVIAESPAEKAGLRAGDVVVQMNAVRIENLKTFSDFLKTLRGGDEVTIRFVRNEVEQVTTATVTLSL